MESPSDVLFSVGLFIGVHWRVILSVDNVDLTSLAVNSWVQLVSDDCGVRSLVVSQEFNLSSSGASDVDGGGDGHSDWAFGCESDSGTEGSVDNDVSFNSGLVFLGQIWNLDGNGGGLTSAEDHFNFSLGLVVTGASLQFDLTNQGDHDWESLFVRQRDTEHGWEFHGVMDQLNNLLVVELLSTTKSSHVEWRVSFPFFLEVLHVNFNKALDSFSQGEEDGAVGSLFHFPLLHTQKVEHLLDDWVLLSTLLGAAAGVQFIKNDFSNLGDSPGLDAQFNWVDSKGTGSKLKVVPVVNVAGDD